MTRRATHRLALAMAGLGLAWSIPGWAEVATTGDTLTDSSNFYAGYNASGVGSLSINGGSQSSNSSGYLGYASGSTGTATVSGTGSKWANTGYLYVGSSGSGSATIESGGQLSSGSGYLGDLAGSTGTVRVSGTGSSWTNGDSLYVGNSGSGSLVIESGGQVSNTSNMTGSSFLTSSYVGNNPDSVGTVQVSGTGSMWTSGTLLVGNGGSGSLSIEDGGQVSTILETHLGSKSGSNGTVTVGGAVSTWSAWGDLYVGESGSGSLTIENGAHVENIYGLFSQPDCYLGYNTGSAGSMTVRGAGSLWTNSGNLYIGNTGNGSLTISDGGQVSTNWSYLGYGASPTAGSTGTATVSGIGSKWANSGVLFVGGGGKGSLVITGGGQVITPSLCVAITSTLRLQVSNNDMLVLGSATSAGGLENNGTICLYATPLLAAGTYTPISAYPGQSITWSGTGTYQAFGGTWDATAHTFRVAAPKTPDSGIAQGIGTGDRLLITDSGTGKQVGVSFASVSAGSTFSATPMNSSELASLTLLLGSGQVLAGWDFGTSLKDTEVLLSYPVGEVAAGDLRFWHVKDGLWSEYTPAYSSYADQTISFTVDSFSGYAVSVPEPAVLGSLWAGGLMLLSRRRRRGIP